MNEAVYAYPVVRSGVVYTGHLSDRAGFEFARRLGPPCGECARGQSLVGLWCS